MKNTNANQEIKKKTVGEGRRANTKQGRRGDKILQERKLLQRKGMERKLKGRQKKERRGTERRIIKKNNGFRMEGKRWERVEGREGRGVYERKIKE